MIYDMNYWPLQPKSQNFVIIYVVWFLSLAEILGEGRINIIFNKVNAIKLELHWSTLFFLIL